MEAAETCGGSQRVERPLLAETRIDRRQGPIDSFRSTCSRRPRDQRVAYRGTLLRTQWWEQRLELAHRAPHPMPRERLDAVHSVANRVFLLVARDGR